MPDSEPRLVLLRLSELLVKITPPEKINELTESSHVFAEFINEKAKESGLIPMQFCFALTELLDTYMPKQFEDSISDLAIVALAGVITTHVDDINSNQKRVN